MWHLWKILSSCERQCFVISFKGEDPLCKSNSVVADSGSVLRWWLLLFNGIRSTKSENEPCSIPLSFPCRMRNKQMFWNWSYLSGHGLDFGGTDRVQKVNPTNWTRSANQHPLQQKGRGEESCPKSQATCGCPHRGKRTVQNSAVQKLNGRTLL